MRFPILSAASVVSLAAASLALAQLPPLSDEFQVDTDTTLSQLLPDVGMDASGNFVVVWGSYQYGPASDVYARRYDSNGNALGLNFLVNTYTTDRQSYPAVAAAPTGEFIVSWSSFHQTAGSIIDVYAQRYDASGNPAGGEFLVNTYTTSYQYGPAIAASASGNFVVIWTSYLQDGDKSGVYGKVFDADGSPVSGEFQVNQYTFGYQSHARVAYGGNGDFVVAWQSRQDGDDYGVMARRFGPDGTPRGDEFLVNQTTTNAQTEPAVAADAAGRFVVTWDNYGQFDSGQDVFARRFGPDGTPRGDEFQVNTYTSNVQDAPRVAMDARGDFVVTWQSDLQDGFGAGVAAVRFDRAGQLIGSEFRPPIQSFNTQSHPSVAAGANGRIVFCWDSDAADVDDYEVLARTTAPLPRFLQVDAQLALSQPGAPSGTALNGVLEPGETVIVVPGWLNNTPSPLPVDGVVSSLTGPPGGTYTIVDDQSDYGTIPSGEIRPCGAAPAGCYSVQVDDPAVRPATHWDATINEEIEPNGTKAWTLHIGESFGDVPDTQPFYRFVETLLHNGVTGGCAASTYCPDASVTRAQMAVFLLKGKHGSSFLPPACTGLFDDVPCPSAFADWIEELSHEGITGGCGGGNYCPSNPVIRQQMAVFLLKAEHGSSYAPPACTGVFPDVPCPSLFADWIEQLAEEAITGGCGGGNFCPTNPNTRGQMAVFLTKTFSLALYGP